MKPHYTALLISLLATLVACVSLRQESPQPASPSPSVSPSASERDRFRPATRILPINIEGEVTGLELKLFDQASLPFTAYVPSKDFTSEVGSSEEGTGTRFYYSPKGVKDEKAYIHIFLPAQATSTEGVQDLLMSDGGLLASNGWELIDRTDIVSFAWAREKLIYRQRTADQTLTGAIFIGEHNGSAFYAFTHYPVEYSDGFEPRSTVVLESLQFRSPK